MERTALMLAAGLLIPSLALSGCDRAKDAFSTLSPDATSADPALEVALLIKNDDPSACAREAALDVALGAANHDYQPFLEEGGPRMRVDAISTREINKSIHEITCSGLLHYQVRDLDRTTQITYKLRPALDAGGGFISEIMDTPGVRLATVLHINAWNEVQLANSEPVEEVPAAEEAPQEPLLPFPHGSDPQDPASESRGADAPAVTDPDSGAAHPADAAAAPDGAAPDR